MRGSARDPRVLRYLAPEIQLARLESTRFTVQRESETAYGLRGSRHPESFGSDSFRSVKKFFSLARVLAPDCPSVFYQYSASCLDLPCFQCSPSSLFFLSRLRRLSRFGLCSRCYRAFSFRVPHSHTTHFRSVYTTRWPRHWSRYSLSLLLQCERVCLVPSLLFSPSVIFIAAWNDQTTGCCWVYCEHSDVGGIQSCYKPTLLYRDENSRQLSRTNKLYSRCALWMYTRPSSIIIQPNSITYSYIYYLYCLLCITDG